MTLAIPLQYSQSQHLTCTLEVNGLAAVFLVDTGASNSCFDQEKDTLFSLQPKGEQLPMTAASETPLHVRESQKITLSSNQQTLMRLPLILIDLIPINNALRKQGDPPIDGILGADVLQEKKAVIDYGKQQLLITL